MKHKCHAAGCDKEIKAKLFMCSKHWSMVPNKLQGLVWKHYRKGQEIDKNPSSKYIEITDNVIWFVRGREYERHGK